MAYEAEATLFSPRGERKVPLAEFFALPSVNVKWENILENDEILVSVFAPAQRPGTRASYLKIRERASFDFALASVAAVLTFEGATCSRARIVLGAVAPIPWRCQAAESVLVGHALDDALIAHASNAALEGVAPLSKNRYKLAMVKGILGRSLGRLSEAS